MHRSCLTSALRRLSLLDPPRSLSTGSTVLSSSSHSTRSPALARPFTLEAPSDAPFRRRNSPRGFQPRPPSPSSSRATRRERPSPPPLPSATDPSVSLDTLDPAHFSHLRRSFLESIGRVPTRAELSNYLPRWLREQANLAERERRKVVRSEWMQDRKRERLDLAWMWEKRKVERLGIERSEHEKRKDERVMKRLEERMRQKRQRELEKELQERDQPWIDLDNKKLTQEEKEELGGGVPAWKRHRAALKEKFPEGWAPPKRISREAMDLLRALHQVDPTTNSVPALGLRFKISPEAVRRVLKSKFELSQAERDKREVKRKEERQRQIASAGGDGLASDPAREDHTWSGDRSRERDEMARLRQRNNESPSSDDRDKSP